MSFLTSFIKASFKLIFNSIKVVLLVSILVILLLFFIIPITIYYASFSRKTRIDHFEVMSKYSINRSIREGNYNLEKGKMTLRMYWFLFVSPLDAEPDDRFISLLRGAELKASWNVSCNTF